MVDRSTYKKMSTHGGEEGRSVGGLVFFTGKCIIFVFAGGDIAVIAYGQPGTGKTYTIFGPGFNCILSETEFGILPRTVRKLFRMLTVRVFSICKLSVDFFKIVIGIHSVA